MNHLLGGQRREAADIFKVNIYIETDNGTKKRVYRGYGALRSFFNQPAHRPVAVLFLIFVKHILRAYQVPACLIAEAPLSVL